MIVNQSGTAPSVVNTSRYQCTSSLFSTVLPSSVTNRIGAKNHTGKSSGFFMSAVRNQGQQKASRVNQIPDSSVQSHFTSSQNQQMSNQQQSQVLNQNYLNGNSGEHKHLTPSYLSGQKTDNYGTIRSQSALKRTVVSSKSPQISSSSKSFSNLWSNRENKNKEVVTGAKASWASPINTQRRTSFQIKQQMQKRAAGPNIKNDFQKAQAQINIFKNEKKNEFTIAKNNKDSNTSVRENYFDRVFGPDNFKQRESMLKQAVTGGMSMLLSSFVVFNPLVQPANAMYLGPKEMPPEYYQCMESTNKNWDLCFKKYADKAVFIPLRLDNEAFIFPRQEIDYEQPFAFEQIDRSDTNLVPQKQKVVDTSTNFMAIPNFIDHNNAPTAFLLFSSLSLNAFFIYNLVLQKAWTNS